MEKKEQPQEEEKVSKISMKGLPSSLASLSLQDFRADLVESMADPLSEEESRNMLRYWSAANYLTIGQIYLRENALLTEPLKLEHIKPRLLGHWGTSPGLSFIYTHANRIIKNTDADMIYVCGPGHGGPAIVANTWLEGSWTNVYPACKQDADGMRTLFRQFSTPGGIPSHCSPQVPGSINEGGELGYVLTHAFGAVMDEPELIAVAVVGDGEAETGPLEGSWKSITFINPVYDGAVLPILQLNGYKISGPTVMGCESDECIKALLSGHGYEVLFCEGDDPVSVNQRLAKCMDYSIAKIRAIQHDARSKGRCEQRPQWPLIVLRTPKGWSGPKEVDGKKVAGTNRAHQVPLSGLREDPSHLKLLEEWLKSYRPHDLFDSNGKLKAELAALLPKGHKRMGAQPYANGGRDPKPLNIPDLKKYEVKVEKAATTFYGNTEPLGELCRDLYKHNPHNFRLFCPDETNSNKLGAVFDTQKRAFMLPVKPYDEAIGADGRVMEVLSEHDVNGWTEGYTLTGRHGLLASYEAFASVFNSMTLQMVKWFEVCIGSDGAEPGLEWRKDIPSINILLTSTCWRNDHNGFSHQGPTFTDTLLTKRGEIVRCYWPPDANSLLVTARDCFLSKNTVNCIVCDKQKHLQFLTLEQAEKHVKAGASIWEFASNVKEGEKPDIVMACAGDVMTQEALAATAWLREKAPDLKVRFVNIVDIMCLYSPDRHPHGLTHDQFDSIFTGDVDVVMSWHGYPGSFHQLIHRRSNPTRFHVRGYNENGTTTTPFDMTVLNGVSRFHLVQLALRFTRRPPSNARALTDECQAMLKKHSKYVVEHMEDIPEIKGWKWPY